MFGKKKIPGQKDSNVARMIKNNPAADAIKERKKSLQELQGEALTRMAKARRVNMNVILTETRNVRYNRVNHISSSADERSILKIKNAYYAINVIDKMQRRIVDAATTQMMYEGMNALSDSMRALNMLYRKGEKPEPGRYHRQEKKLEKNEDRATRILSKMYENGVDNINDLVSNEVIDRLVADGASSVEDLLRQDQGIRLTMDDLSGLNDLDLNAFNFDDLMGDAAPGGGEGGGMAEDLELETPPEDMSDFAFDLPEL